MQTEGQRKEVHIMSPELQLQPEIITLEQYEALPEEKRVDRGFCQVWERQKA